MKAPPKILFKYVGFKNEKYWMEPARDKTLYLSSVEELRSGNDPQEFKYSFHNHGHFFVRYMNGEIKGVYKKLFDMARVLCLSKDYSERLYNEYCGTGGGVCYEFQVENFNHDVSHDHVIYAQKKRYNAAKFFVEEVQDMHMPRLLSKTKTPSKKELAYIHSWLVQSENEASKLSVRHIKEELIWKKPTSFRYENEYRYIYLVERINQPLKVDLRGSKVNLEDIGLKLLRIHTSDMKKTRTALCSPPEIIPFNFDVKHT